MSLKKIILLIYILLITSLLAEDNKFQALEIYKNLRCLICQGQSIADSNSDFAATIKLVVQDQINEGKTKNEVYNFLITKYLQVRIRSLLDYQYHINTDSF